MKIPPLRSALLLLAALAWPLSVSAQYGNAPARKTEKTEKPVPVLQEPNHHVTLENAYLRMIDVHFEPGKTTLYHVHTVPSVVV